jgi:predicted nuclease of predicted toxin-antitoxin system
MPEVVLRILLDQNVPRAAGAWLKTHRPGWEIAHTSELALSLRSDEEIFRWAQNHRQIVVSFDEDFADARFFSLGSHCGVIRLRVWPTTIEETIAALQRLLNQVPETDWPGSLIIIERGQIRLRRAAPTP